MQPKIIVAVMFVLSTLVFAQAQEQYFDVYYTQIKPEKRADFDGIAKKIADANRTNHGDTWLALDTVYGTGSRVSFVSIRGSYADISKANDVFMGSVAKSYGEGAAQQLFQDLNACTVSTRGELRRIRFDLSSDVSPDTLAKILGESRWLRTTIVHLKPGQLFEFERLLRQVKDDAEKAARTIIVAQAVAGMEGTVFYITVPAHSLGDYDSFPSMHQLLGDVGDVNYQRVNAETVQSAETVITRVVPELSNAPSGIAAVDPDFWAPKSAAKQK